MGREASHGKALDRFAQGITNGGIMTAAVSGGMKMAHNSPTLIGKASSLVGSLAVGSTAILLKDKTSSPLARSEGCC